MNYRKIRSLGRRESPGVKKLILTTIISLGVGFAAASWLETAFVAPGSQSDDQAGPVEVAGQDLLVEHKQPVLGEIIVVLLGNVLRLGVLPGTPGDTPG